MDQQIVFDRTRNQAPESAGNMIPYHSVVFSIEGLDSLYQFKLWHTESLPLCFLMRPDSELLNRLKVGDKLNPRYYQDGSAYPAGCFETTIQTIRKSERGRFKGHYLVGLQISEPFTPKAH